MTTARIEAQVDVGSEELLAAIDEAKTAVHNMDQRRESKRERIAQIRQQLANLDKDMAKADGAPAKNLLNERTELLTELTSLPTQLAELERERTLAELRELRLRHELAEALVRSSRDELKPVADQMDGLRRELVQLDGQRRRNEISHDERSAEHHRIQQDMRQLEEDSESLRRAKSQNLQAQRVISAKIERKFGSHPLVKSADSDWRFLYQEHLWPKLAVAMAEDHKLSLRSEVPEAF